MAAVAPAIAAAAMKVAAAVARVMSADVLRPAEKAVGAAVSSMKRAQNMGDMRYWTGF